MKRRALWIIGITTAVVTSIGLRAAVGHRYAGNRFNGHPTCWQKEKAHEKENAVQQRDSAQGR